jgi:POT family proton-dependent oligopeptide transporter
MGATAASADGQLSNSNGQFLGHPRGLAYLGFTEGWERFSYYGMLTLLVLYMSRYLLQPGHVETILGFSAFRSFLDWQHGHHLSAIELSSNIFGLYAGLVWMLPIFGGALADRWLGRTRAITIGAVLMACGHFLLAFEAPFLLALLCLLVGVGCFKGNMASQVGELYSAGDLRRASAYQIYLLFINIAVIVSPLVCGTLGEGYGWHYGFAAAGFGMLISLCIYRSGRPWLPAPAPERRRSIDASGRRLSASQIKTILVLLLLMPVLALGALGNEQVSNAFLLWVPDHVNLMFMGHTVPTSWLISMDAALTTLSLAVMLAFWRWCARRFHEPSDTTKIAIGLMLSAAGLAMLVIAASMSASGHKAGFGWVLAFDLLNNLGYANIFPLGLALYARAAPDSLRGTIIGIYYLHLFIANYLVGWLGGMLEHLSGTQFWALHLVLVSVAAAAFTVLAIIFRARLSLTDAIARRAIETDARTSGVFDRRPAELTA